VLLCAKHLLSVLSSATLATPRSAASSAAADPPAELRTGVSVCDLTHLLSRSQVCAFERHTEGVNARGDSGTLEFSRAPWPIAMPLHDGSPLPPPAPPAPLPPSAAVVNHLRAVESAQRRRALLHVNEVADRCFRECVTDFGFTKCAHLPRTSVRHPRSQPQRLATNRRYLRTSEERCLQTCVEKFLLVSGGSSAAYAQSLAAP
jgi:hypothetical protein